MSTQPRRSAWFRGIVKPSDADAAPLPDYVDPELACMRVMLYELQRLEDSCGTAARDRALRWLTERMDQGDRDRAAQLREIEH